MAELLVTAVQLAGEGVTLEYLQLPDDVRAGGHLVATHSLAIADVEDYGEGIAAVRDAVHALLRDALEDFATTEAVDPAQLAEEGDDDDDDD